MKFRFIAAQKAKLTVERACELMDVSPSGYYAACERPVSRRARQDMTLLAHIRSAFTQSNETYGSPRMVHELREAGFDVGRRRVARLMREDGLQARIKRRFKCTTDSAHSHPIAHNHLDRAFSPTKQNTAWAVDMTYIWTKEGWLYLAIVMDLYSRRIVGWSAGPRMKAALPLEALNRAIALRRPQPSLIHHSDRGSQYCAYEYRDRLAEIGATVSMSGKGNCYDNAVVETFFKTLKSELVWRMTFHTRSQALSEIGQYIDGFYNPVRRHSACAYTSPIKYETMNN
jgi:putative transposase